MGWEVVEWQKAWVCVDLVGATWGPGLVGTPRPPRCPRHKKKRLKFTNRKKLNKWDLSY